MAIQLNADNISEVRRSRNAFNSYGREGYHDSGDYLSSELIKIVGRVPVIYLPIQTGGEYMGKPFEDSMKYKNIPMIKHPVIRNREQRIIISPTLDTLKETSYKLKQKSKIIVALAYDDVIATGDDINMLYNYLCDHQNELEIQQIIRACHVDCQGIADISYINHSRLPTVKIVQEENFENSIKFMHSVKIK